MTPSEWWVLAAGVALLLGAAPWHLAGLRLIRRLQPYPGDHPALALVVTFWGLIVLHLSEIVVGAFAFSFVLSFEGTGEISGGWGMHMANLLYFAGITYATLGYTSQTAEGPIRLLAMLNSLGGFMLITWSATFVYSIWENQFRKEDEAEEEAEKR